MCQNLSLTCSSSRNKIQVRSFQIASSVFAYFKQPRRANFQIEKLSKVVKNCQIKHFVQNLYLSKHAVSAPKIMQSFEVKLVKKYLKLSNVKHIEHYYYYSSLRSTLFLPCYRCCFKLLETRHKNMNLTVSQLNNVASQNDTDM